MNHLYEVYLTEAHRNGTRLAKYNNMNASNQEDRQAPCKNGDNCRFHSQFRCMFYHKGPPQKRQVQHKRQAPSSQWKVVHPRWQNRNHQQVVHQSQDQALPPWCTYGSRCKLGRPGSWNQCLLRHEGEDFPHLPQQGRQ